MLLSFHRPLTLTLVDNESIATAGQERLEIDAYGASVVLRRSLFRSNLLNGKQKTAATLGQQPPAFQTNTYDQQLWQQHFPPLRPTTNLPAPLTDTNSSHESKAETSRKADGLSRPHETDPRSLLGKSVTLSCFQQYPSFLSFRQNPAR